MILILHESDITLHMWYYYLHILGNFFVLSLLRHLLNSDILFFTLIFIIIFILFNFYINLFYILYKKPLCKNNTIYRNKNHQLKYVVYDEQPMLGQKNKNVKNKWMPLRIRIINTVKREVRLPAYRSVWARILPSFEQD